MIKIISNKIVFIFLFFISFDFIEAGTQIDTYLNATYYDSSIEKKKELFEKYAYKRNYIEKLRSKVEVSEFEDIETMYSIQAFPKSFSEMDIEEKMYQLKKSFYTSQRESSKKVKDRYMTVLEAFYHKQLYRGIHKQIKLYKEKLDLASNTLYKSSDVEKLLKIKHKLADLEIKSFKREKAYEILLNSIKSQLASSKKLDLEFSQNWVIGSIEMVKNLDSIISNVSFVPKKKDLYDVALLQQKVALEDAKNKWKIRNFGLDYDDSKRRGNAFSMSMSIEVPLDGENDSKQLNSRLKLLKAKDKLLNMENSIDDKVSLLKDKIIYFSQYIQKINDSYINVDKYVAFFKTSGVDPQFLLDLKKENLAYDMEKIKAYFAMRKVYINLLALSGRLMSPNGQNFLASN